MKNIIIKIAKFEREKTYRFAYNESYLSIPLLNQYINIEDIGLMD
jgi:hypothetical protein